MKSFHMLRDSNLHHLLITGKITYSNTMQEPPSAKTLSWLDASETVKGPSSWGTQTALLVHRLVYEIDRTTLLLSSYSSLPSYAHLGFKFNES